MYGASGALQEEAALSEDETVVRLRRFGLNLYESRAYVALLNAKRLTAGGVWKAALVPQSRTYDVLESLVKKGFVLATPSSPVEYSPVPPAEVLRDRFESLRKKIKERAATMQEEAQTELDAISDAYATLSRGYDAGASEVEAPDQVWVIKKRENIENTLAGLIREARSVVLRITKPPDPSKREPVDPFYIVGLENQRYVYDALDRKVKMRWLSLTREIPTFLGLEVSEPPTRRFLERDKAISEKFLLVDDRAVLLNLHDPVSTGYGHVALAIRSKAASAIFLEHFERMWDRGKPLGEVLPKAVVLVEQFCEEMRDRGLGKHDITLYKTLARTGAVTQDVLIGELGKRRIKPQEGVAAFERMSRLGLVHRVGPLRLLMVEHPATARTLVRALDKRGQAYHSQASQ